MVRRQGHSATYPNLGGQHYSYLPADAPFKGGDRYAQLMMLADNLPDETLKNIAAFYADKALQEGDLHGRSRSWGKDLS